VLALVWSGGAEAGKGEAAESLPGSWHCTAYVRGSIGIRVIDYWSRGPDMLARTLIKGHPITTIVAGGRYVVYDGLTGEGVDIARAPAAIAADAGRLRPFAFELEEIKAQGGEKVEDVTIGAMRGEVWQVRDGQGRRKLWVASGPPGVPIRLETFDRASGETIELDYQSWIFDLPLPDDFFRPPQGIRLERFELDGWLKRGSGDAVPAVPILYPDLLFGAPPRSE